SRSFLPTPSAYMDLWGAHLRGLAELGTRRPPVDASTEVLGLVAVAAVVMLLVADLIAVAARMPAVAGLVLVVPWLPAVIFQYEVAQAILLAALGGWVILVGLQ